MGRGIRRISHLQSIALFHVHLSNSHILSTSFLATQSTGYLYERITMFPIMKAPQKWSWVDGISFTAWDLVYLAKTAIAKSRCKPSE